MVRRATIEDSHILAELAIQLWDDNTPDALNAEFSESINSNQAVFFIKYEDNIPVGFAQCSLRTDYVEGTETSPVGYLEGIFVKSAHRNRGYAKELVCACESWSNIVSNYRWRVEELHDEPDADILQRMQQNFMRV